MSPHDMIKKKTKEVEAQAGPVEIQRKREEAMFVQSITRQYEEARKQETKLGRQLRQGPPDSVIKKSRWSRSYWKRRIHGLPVFTGDCLAEKKRISVHSSISGTYKEIAEYGNRK